MVQKRLKYNWREIFSLRFESFLAWTKHDDIKQKLKIEFSNQCLQHFGWVAAKDWNLIKENLEQNRIIYRET